MAGALLNFRLILKLWGASRLRPGASSLTALPSRRPFWCHNKAAGCKQVKLDFISRYGKSTFKGTVSPPERCDFTSSQQYNNNVLWSLFIMFWDQNSNYFHKFIWIEDWVLITDFCGIISRIEPYYFTPLLSHKYDKLEKVRGLFQVSRWQNHIPQQVTLCL